MLLVTKPNWRMPLVAALLAPLMHASLLAQPPGVAPAPPPPGAGSPAETRAVPGSILGSEVQVIDLDSALRLGGTRNPELMIARERVTEAAAARQLAAAQLLPSINAGTNYDDHTGNLQQSTGAMLNVHRQSLYLGAGAGAVGAGTVTIPGVVWNAQVSELIFNNLIAQQVVAQRSFGVQVTRNNVLLAVAVAYEELLRAEARRAVAIKNRDDTQEIARLTAAYAKTGQGRKADADRAATELSRRDYDVTQAEGRVLTASAALNRLLSLDPACRLRPSDRWAVPATIVATEIPMKELIASAVVRRPELCEQQAVIRQAFYSLRNARALPFTPNVLVGYSTGTFGGGSDLSPPELGNFQGRSDFDVVAYWTLRNLGVGNVALIRGAQSRLRTENYQLIRVLDQIRDEVAEGYARAQARWAQIGIGEKAVHTAENAYQEDLRRIRGQEGLPIEVLDSMRLLGQGRNDYLNAIVDYNRAELELYVALGQPPANVLARPAPAPGPETIQLPIPEPPAIPAEK
jgi:outer membrane protein TolC